MSEEEKKSKKFTKNKNKALKNLDNENIENAKKRTEKAVEKIENESKKRSTLYAVMVTIAIILAGFYLFQDFGSDDKEVNVPKHILEIEDMKFSEAEFEEVLTNSESLSNKTELFESFINEALLLKYAQDQNLTVSDEEVDAYFENILSMNQKTLDEFKLELSAQNISLETFKKYLKKTLKIGLLINEEISSSIQISDEEAEAFYNTNKGLFQVPESFNVSHILFENDLEKAENVLDEANSTDFLDLVAEYENNSKQALTFEFYRGTVDPNFQKAVDSVETGLVPYVVNSSFGYHVVFVHSKSDASVISFEDAKQNIVESLKQSKTTEAIENLVKNLKENYKVWINIDLTENYGIDYSYFESEDYNLKNIRSCINEDEDIVYFSDKKIPGVSNFYDLTNDATKKVFAECLSDKVDNLKSVKTPVFVCTKNDVVLEGSNLNKISTIC